MQTRQDGHHIHQTEKLRMCVWCLVCKTQRALAKLISFDRQTDRQAGRERETIVSGWKTFTMLA